MTEQGFFLLFALISVFISLIYGGFILWLSFVFELKKKEQEQSNFEPTISLIVAFRNEENTILLLLQSILQQNYSKSKMEIILVDDSSTDKSLYLAKTFQEKHPELHIKLFELSKEKPHALGKKEALILAYTIASGDYILLSDADCKFSKNNFKTRVQAFKNPKIKLVSAAVLISENKTILASAQALENLSLVATTAATTAANLPILCNGANLAFERQAYFELPKNALVKEENSGDDLFLLHSFKKYFGALSIAFEFNKDSVVYTQAQPNFKSFFNQRKRWVSKSKSYKDAWIIMISLLVLAVNLSIVFAGSASVLNSYYLVVFGLLFAIKFSVDLLILYRAAKWYGQNKLLWIYPLVQVFYPPFIVISSLLSPFLSYEWKGRKY
jgi:cellulose synthase/poly-beta-1,6-N-acetylglucosamine synthase-like glycosyltransferase